MGQQQMAGQQQMQQQQQQQQQAEEAAAQKKGILKQILEPDALDRISRIALVKVEKVAQLENFIIAKVRAGEISSKVSDDQLLRYMDEMEKKGGGGVKSIRVQRKRDDSDDDLDLED